MNGLLYMVISKVWPQLHLPPALIPWTWVVWLMVLAVIDLWRPQAPQMAHTYQQTPRRVAVMATGVTVGQGLAAGTAGQGLVVHTHIYICVTLLSTHLQPLKAANIVGHLCLLTPDVAIVLCCCSACSRETDNQQVEDPNHALDISWQSKLNLQALQQQQQHDMNNASPSIAAAVAAARSLAAAAAQTGGFDLSQFAWGLGRPEFADAAAAALQGLNPAQALALLSNPFYQAGLAAADCSGQHAALQTAAAVAGNAGNEPAGGLVRTSGGAAGSSGALDATTDTAGRTKSRRTAPSVNSGSTGPPTGTKRLFTVGSEECLLPVRKVRTCWR